MSTSAVQSSLSRDRILAAAKEVFANRGYRGGSINEIAKAVGLTRAGLLHHFPGKEAVLMALLDSRDRELDEIAPAEPRSMSLLQLLRDLEPGIPVILGDREMVQLAHILTAEASGDDHPAHDWVASRHRRFRATLAAAAAHSIEIGELDSALDPEVVASLVLSVIEGAENQWLLAPETVSPSAIMKTVRQLLDPVRRFPAG